MLAPMSRGTTRWSTSGGIVSSRADSNGGRPDDEDSGALREVEHRDGASGSVDLQGDHLPSPSRQPSDRSSIRVEPDGKSPRRSTTAAAPYLPTDLHGVLANRVRHAILTLAGDRPWSATELAKELDLPRRQITDQIEELKKTNPPLLEFVGKKAGPNGGAMHMYRAIRYAFDAEQWQMFTPLEQAVSSGTTVKLLTEELGRALVDGTLYSHPDHVLYRDRHMVDHEGMRNIGAILTEAAEAVVEEAAASVQRLADSDEPPIPILFGLISAEVAPKGSAPKKSGS